MYLGIDVGGTKTLIAALDETGTIIEQVKFPTASDYLQFIAEVSDHLVQMSSKSFVSAAVGIPGRIDRESGIVLALGNLPWRDKPIRNDIAQIVKCPVVVENDAKTAALAEALLVLSEYKRVLYLTIGTGIGGGLVVNGKLEPNLLDSEIGKSIFPHNDQLLEWEAFASGKAIAETYHQKASDISDPVTWNAIAENVGLGVIVGCAVFQPEAIIFGGGVGSHFQKFAEPLQAFLDTHLHPVIRKPKLLADQHGELSVIYGCYELAKHTHAQSN
jgi:predicted NBD/HSP70 family sugar kinase